MSLYSTCEAASMLSGLIDCNITTPDFNVIALAFGIMKVEYIHHTGSNRKYYDYKLTSQSVDQDYGIEINDGRKTFVVWTESAVRVICDLILDKDGLSLSEAKYKGKLLRDKARKQPVIL